MLKSFHNMWLQGYSVVADLLKVSDCKRTVEEAVARMGGLDILVNCGGVWTDAILSDHLGEQGFSDAFKMHVITPAQLIEEAIPHLSKNKVHYICFTLSKCSSGDAILSAHLEKQDFSNAFKMLVITYQSV